MISLHERIFNGLSGDRNLVLYVQEIKYNLYIYIYMVKEKKKKPIKMYQVLPPAPGTVRIEIMRYAKPIILTLIGCMTRRGDRLRAQNLFLATMKILRKKLLMTTLGPILGLDEVYFKNTKIRGKPYRARSRLTPIVLSPYIALIKAVIKASPRISLQSKRVGGVIYRLPRIIRNDDRAHAQVVRWIVRNARLRKERGGFQERLAKEIYETYRGRSATIRKKTEIYRIAAANRPFMHYLRKKPSRR
jgi:ribosomal protein S7